MSDALLDHLATGATTVCRCWAVGPRGRDTLGFTDHDQDLSFDGIEFRSDRGFAASALEQSTGLAVDNSEVVGVLNDPAITETDIAAGRFDGAAVRVWQVNWTDPAQRRLIFRGSLGQIERSGKTFRAELRSLADRLQVPVGRAYQTPCSAVLGDARCGIALVDSAFAVEAVCSAIEGGVALTFPELAHAEGWFARGRLVVVDGAAEGVVGSIKRDRIVAGSRQIELWEMLSAGFSPGDRVRLEVGCDKRLETCRTKFDNILNFRGFPDIPGDDWLVSYPVSAGVNDGGSLRR